MTISLYGCTSIFSALSSRPKVSCESLNQSDPFEYLLPYPQVYPINQITWSEYLTQAASYLSLHPDPIQLSQFHENQRSFIELCSRFDACTYIPDINACQSYTLSRLKDIFPSYFIIHVLCTSLAALSVLWFLLVVIIGPKRKWMQDMIRSSWASPLYRFVHVSSWNEYFDTMINHQSSYRDLFRRFLLKTCLRDLPLSFTQTYFSVGITQVGLEWNQVGGLVVSMVSVLVDTARIVWVFYQSYKVSFADTMFLNDVMLIEATEITSSSDIDSSSMHSPLLDESVPQA